MIGTAFLLLSFAMADDLEASQTVVPEHGAFQGGLSVEGFRYLAIFDQSPAPECWINGRGMQLSVGALPRTEIPHFGPVVSLEPQLSRGIPEAGTRRPQRTVDAYFTYGYRDGTFEKVYEGYHWVAGGDADVVIATPGLVQLGPLPDLFAPLSWYWGELSRCQFGELSEETLVSFLHGMPPFGREVSIAILTAWVRSRLLMSAPPRRADVQYEHVRECVGRRKGDCTSFVKWFVERAAGHLPQRREFDGPPRNLQDNNKN